MWEDYQCYFVVIDSQCDDAFSQVSIIGDAFKVYLTRCFVIICHSSASEWLFNVSGVKLSFLAHCKAYWLMRCRARYALFLAYCKAYCSLASQIFFWRRSLSDRFQYKTKLTESDTCNAALYIHDASRLLLKQVS